MTSLPSRLVLLGAAALVGCDLPTDAPMVEQEWMIPLENTSISVEEFLPTGVGLLGDLFGVTVDPFTAEATLGELCTSCVDGPGPVPGFQGTFSGFRPFPPDVLSAVLETGAVTIALQNGLSFDPTAGGGSVVITISDGPGGKVLGQATISAALAPGSIVTRAISLAGGPMGPKLMASAEVFSPGGQVTTIDTGQKLVLNVEPTSIQVSFATLRVAGRPVELGTADLGVADLDETVSDRIRSGSLLLDVTNPFGVEVTVDLVITFPGGSLSRTVDLEGTAVSQVSASYTGDELRSFLGKEGVTLAGTGVVSSAAKPVLVRTGERLELDANLALTLVIG